MAQGAGCVLEAVRKLTGVMGNGIWCVIGACEVGRLINSNTNDLFFQRGTVVSELWNDKDLAIGADESAVDCQVGVGEESDSQTIQEAALICTSLGCGLHASPGGRGRGGVGSFAIALDHTGFDD